MKPKVHVPVFLFVAMVGCAQIRGDKPGADAKSLKQQPDECRRLARSRTSGAPLRFTLLSPQVVSGGAGFAAVPQNPLIDADAVLHEHSCMGEKGFVPVPVETGIKRVRE